MKKSLIKEDYTYDPVSDEQEGVKYYVDMTWYGEDGREYGDMGYTFEDEADAYSADLKDCIDNVRESFKNPEEYDVDYIRTDENPNPMVATIVRCVGDMNPVDGDEVYKIANCGEDVAKQYGIQADEYIETMPQEPTQEDWDNVMFNDDEEEPELTNSEMDNYYNNQDKLDNSMKKTINEAQLRNMIRKMVKESMENMMDSADNSELQAAENWWNSLSPREKREICTEVDYDGLVQEFYDEGGKGPVDAWKDDILEDFYDNFWSYFDDEDKIKIYHDYTDDESGQDPAMVNESMQDMMDGAGEEELSPEYIANNLIERAEDDPDCEVADLNADSTYQACVTMVERTIAKHPELQTNDEVEDYLCNKTKNYMKFFSKKKWLRNASLEELAKYFEHNYKDPMARAQKEYAKYHGDAANAAPVSGEIAGINEQKIAEAIAKNITKALKNL